MSPLFLGIPIPSKVGEFIVVSIAIIIAPGPSVLFTIARAISWGRKVAVLTVIGNATGFFAMSTLVAVGVGPIIQSSDFIYAAVQWGGGLYLMYLGFDAIRKRNEDTHSMLEAGSANAPSTLRTIRDGFVEVNPLVRTEDNRIIALDGKVTLDDNAGFRHPEHEALVDHAATNPLEALAKEKDLNYVKLDGQVGIIGNGAGLVMSTLDVVAYAGEKFGGMKPANFLDIGGGASAQVMADGLSIILNDKDVKSVFVNVFGGITACDAVANGIIQALEILGTKATKPIVVRLDGNNVLEGRRILKEANHPLVEQAETMDGAAARAAELAAK